jgi:hypothetical protein
MERKAVAQRAAEIRLNSFVRSGFHLPHPFLLFQELLRRLMRPIDRAMHMDLSMAAVAECDQILGCVVPQRTSPALMMHLEPGHRSAALTSPSISLEDLLAESVIRLRIET